MCCDQGYFEYHRSIYHERFHISYWFDQAHSHVSTLQNGAKQGKFAKVNRCLITNIPKLLTYFSILNMKTLKKSLISLG